MSDMIDVGSQLPNIERMKVEGGYGLRLKFQGQAWRGVTLEGLISRYAVLQPLRDASVFAGARIIDDGAAIGWPSDTDIGASTLWHLAEEQKRFGAKDLVRWQPATGLSNAEAANALGLSLATIKNYRAGASIPAAVAIACRAMAAEPTTLAAHLRPRRTGRPKAA